MITLHGGNEAQFGRWLLRLRALTHRKRLCLLTGLISEHGSYPARHSAGFSKSPGLTICAQTEQEQSSKHGAEAAPSLALPEPQQGCARCNAWKLLTFRAERQLDCRANSRAGKPHPHTIQSVPVLTQAGGEVDRKRHFTDRSLSVLR